MTDKKKKENLASLWYLLFDGLFVCGWFIVLPLLVFIADYPWNDWVWWFLGIYIFIDLFSLFMWFYCEQPGSSFYNGLSENIAKNHNHAPKTINVGRYCPMCKGTGRCVYCAGSGHFNYQARQKVKLYTDCTFCIGTGVCTTCNGKGRV